MPVKPKKNPGIIDIAIRQFISDLLDRGQIKLSKFALKLGYKDSSELFRFLKAERNYSRPRLKSTIDILVDSYNANREFLETGHGKMYSAKPYMTNEDVTLASDTENIATIASRQRIKKLEETVKKLHDRIKQLEEILKAKEDSLKAREQMIELQKQVIENLTQPPSLGLRG